MSRRSGRQLTAEDRILWRRVAESVRPLHGASLDEMEGFEKVEPAPLPSAPPQLASAESAPTPSSRRTATPRPTGLDHKTHGKIARGRLSIEARIDLHGMTQAEAHGLLLSFLHRAHASGLRHVLVITGKGRTGGGVLRQAVPQWLRTAPFNGLVGAHAPAARHHGGEGALYLRLRRARGE